MVPWLLCYCGSAARESLPTRSTPRHNFWRSGWWLLQATVKFVSKTLIKCNCSCFALISPKCAQILRYFAQSYDCMIAAFRNSGNAVILQAAFLSYNVRLNFTALCTAMLYAGGITLLSTVSICHVIIDSSHIYSIVINNITSFGLEDVEFLFSPPLLVFLHYHKTVQITWWHPCWPFLMTSLDDIIWWHHKCSWWTFSFSLLLLCWYSSTVIKHPSSQSNIVLPGLKNISHRSGPGGGNEEEFEKYKKED